MTVASLVAIKGVSRVYGVGKEAVLALQDVSLDITPGEFLTVLGPSGCGKSTLLNILAGFDVPTSGSATMHGRVIGGPDAKRGVVFQDTGALFPWLSIRDNIGFGLRAAGIGRAETARRVDEVLSLTRLQAFGSKYPAQLSGGMRQLVAIARILVMDAELLLMDEPFAALDAITRQRMQAELALLWSERRTAVMFITHSVDEALYLGDRVCVMSARPGRVIADLTIDLPRPRDVAGAVFNELRGRALQLLGGASPGLVSAGGKWE